MALLDYFRGRNKASPKPVNTFKEEESYVDGVIPPGRVSVPDTSFDTVVAINNMTGMVTPSFRAELIPLIRRLYKINPDVSIAVQDMFKLANTGHVIQFPKNSENETQKMLAHLDSVSAKWSPYTGGINGLVNKLICQILVGGAFSFEAVPNNEISGLSTIIFVNPEVIHFKRENDGRYHPYQRVRGPVGIKEEFVRLNTETYKYIGLFGDTDEPYGIPPFIAALDSLATQHHMKVNFKHIIETAGLLGFLQVLMAKPLQKSGESATAYNNRLRRTLTQLKASMVGGMKDGLVTGYKDDHEFNLQSTTKDLKHVMDLWGMNEQGVANGLGVNGNIIGLNSTKTEGGQGIMLSKMISQLKNIQMLVSYALEFIYSLELRLAGFNNKGLKVKFLTSTVSDEVKVQQGMEYKIRNTRQLYMDGIIDRYQYSREVGYDAPAFDEEIYPMDGSDATGDVDDSAQKKADQESDNTTDRRTRDKAKTTPKRTDQKTVPR